jgi:hypothetical protein
VTGWIVCASLAANACAAVPGPRGARLAPSEGVAEPQAQPAPAVTPLTPPPAGTPQDPAAPADPALAPTVSPPASLPPPNEAKSEPPPAGYDDAARGTSIPADPHRTRRIWGYAAIAIGAEAAVVAGVTSFMLLHQKGVVDDGCDAQKRCSSTGLAETGAVSQTVPVNNVAWTVAAVGLIGGGILLLTSQPESGKSTALTVAPNVGGASLGLRRTF